MSACLVATLVLLQWVTPALAKEKPLPFSPVVARVGSYAITKRDVEYRNKVIALDTPEIKGDYGLKQLIKHFTYAQVLADQGWKVTDEILQKESDRIDAHTLLPEKLAELKGIFGFDKESYLRLFVLPTYVERVIFYEFFAMNPGVHSTSKRAPRELLNDVLRRPADFEALAKRMGHEVGHFTVSEKDGIKTEMQEVPDLLAKRALAAGPSTTVPTDITEHLKKGTNDDAAGENSRWVKEVAGTLKPGEVFPKIMEFQERWLIVRYLGPARPEVYRFEGVTFPKANFDEWFERQKKKVKVVILPG